MLRQTRESSRPQGFNMRAIIIALVLSVFAATTATAAPVTYPTVDNSASVANSKKENAKVYKEEADRVTARTTKFRKEGEAALEELKAQKSSRALDAQEVVVPKTKGKIETLKGSPQGPAHVQPGEVTFLTED